MEMTSRDYISDLTGLSRESVDKLRDLSLEVISHQLKNHIDEKESKEIEIDKYGKILIEMKDQDEFELNFLPSKELLDAVRFTIVNKKSLLVDSAEKMTINQIRDKFDPVM